MEGGVKNDMEMADLASINNTGKDVDIEFTSKDTPEIREQLERECTPMKMTNFMIKRPCVVMLSCFFILIIFAFISVNQKLFNIDEGGSRDFFILDDPIVMDQAKFSLAREAYADT
jgi:hypothetical protein